MGTVVAGLKRPGQDIRGARKESGNVLNESDSCL